MLTPYSGVLRNRASVVALSTPPIPLLQFSLLPIILKMVVISVGYHASMKALPGPFADVG